MEEISRPVPGGKERRLADVPAIAERLGVTVRHVRRLVLERRVPYYKVGRFVRFDLDEIDEWLDSQRRPPLQDQAG